MKNDNSTSEEGINGAGYMLFFRGREWDEGLSPGQLQVALDEVIAWFDKVCKSGKVKGGQPLARAGRTISGENGSSVTDGPFAESKEAVGGYLHLDVATMEEAVAIGKSCPTLKYGITVEVRPVLEECPIFKRARRKVEFAMA